MLSLPKLECKKKCQAFCGTVYPLACSRKEANQLEHFAALVNISLDISVDQSCQFLSPVGLCSCYSIRPAICRLFGLVPEMKCPHGCLPERWLSSEEVSAFLRESGVNRAEVRNQFKKAGII